MKIDKQQHGTAAPMAATTAATTEAPTAATSTAVHTASVLRVAPPIGFAHVRDHCSDQRLRMQEGRWRRSNRPYLATCCEYI